MEDIRDKLIEIITQEIRDNSEIGCKDKITLDYYSFNRACGGIADSIITSITRFLKSSKQTNLNNDDKYVTVIDNGFTYPTYPKFLSEHFNEYLSHYCPHEVPENNKIYKYIGCGQHYFDTCQTVFLIQDIETRQVFTIQNVGCKMYSDISSNYLATKAEVEADLEQLKRRIK